VPFAHQAIRVEFPILVSVRPNPVARLIDPLIREAYRNAIFSECPELLYEPVLLFGIPVACEECYNLVAPSDEFGAISPFAVGGIRKRNWYWFSSIPRVLSLSHFQRGCFKIERRNRWPLF
jgi:hypothetical protein